jgi:multiple sugar transport system substrate-binding protein
VSRARALAVIASLAAGALACGDGGGGAVTLRVWAMGREGEVLDHFAELFERAHPEIHVEVQQLPWTTAHEKLLTAFVGDSTPDLAQLGNTWLPELAALGALMPLDAELARSRDVQPADYFAGIWDTNRVDDRVYGVPWYVDTRLVFYRKDLFAAAGYAQFPARWPDWLAALRAIKAQVGPDRFAILLPLDEFEQLLAFALQQDQPVIRDGRWGNFRSPGFRKALTFYLQMFAERLAPLVTEVQVSNPWDELARGYFACFLHGPWSIGELKRRLPEREQGLWATAPLPGPDGPGASIASGSSLVVFRRSPHAHAAWQFIEYLSQPDNQRRFYALTGDLPPRRAGWQSARLADDVHVQAFRDQLERVRRTPPVPEWERIATEMRIVSERAARQVSPATTPVQLAAIVDAAVTELDRRTDQILDKRRWVLDHGAPER